MTPQDLFDKMIILPKVYGEVTDVAKKILRNKSRYQLVSVRTGVPFEVIGIIHYREGDLDFGTHLANGDSLRKRTIHVPRGTPSEGTPPFTWEFAAEYALNANPWIKGRKFWGISGIADALEHFNGMGYAKRGLRSPYLWAGSNWQQKGKFISDGKFSAGTWDTQLGCMILLRRIRELDGMVEAKPQEEKSMSKKGFGIVAALAAFFGMAFAAYGADGVALPVGDWIGQGLGVIQPVLGSILMAVLTYAVGKVFPAGLQYLRTQAVEQLLDKSVAWGINSVEGAAKGKELNVTLGNAVLNEALSYAVDKGPAKLIAWLGGPEAIQHMIVARLNLAPEVSAQKLGVSSLGG